MSKHEYCPPAQTADMNCKWSRQPFECDSAWGPVPISTSTYSTGIDLHRHRRMRRKVPGNRDYIAVAKRSSGYWELESSESSADSPVPKGWYVMSPKRRWSGWYHLRSTAARSHSCAPRPAGLSWGGCPACGEYCGWTFHFPSINIPPKHILRLIRIPVTKDERLHRWCPFDESSVDWCVCCFFFHHGSE